MTGCASIVSGQNQSVTVTTRASGAEVSGAKCSLTNDKGKWYTSTPGSVTVRRSYGDLAVNCTHDTLEPGTQAFKSTTKAMAFGNVIFGGVIGATIDVTSGAAYDYPEQMQVNMGPASTAAAASAPGAAVALVPAAAPPPRSQTLLGTRFVIRDLDSVSGAATGELSLTLTGLSSSEAEFNDGAVKLGLTGQMPSGGASRPAIAGIRVSDLVVGNRAQGSLAPGGSGEVVSVELTVTSVESLPAAMGALRVARVQVNGYAARATAASVSGAPISGDVLVDATTGLVLNANVASRAGAYALRREIVKVVRPDGVAPT